VSEVHQLSRADARRVAVRAQLLTADRPADLGVLGIVQHLTMLQPDPVRAVAPSADLVLWSRLGSSYEPAELQDAVDRRLLLTHRGQLRPAADLALFRAEMAQWPGPPPLRPWQEEQAAWVQANDACRRDLLERLRGDGPLPASALPDTCAVPWASSGWTNDKNVQQLLKLMVLRGEVAAAGREGREMRWDLAERIYPDDPVPPPAEAARILDARRLAALGIARSRAPESPGEPHDVGEAGEPAVVEGVRGTWRVEPTLLGAPFVGRTALLSPLDRLVFDRSRMEQLFGFDYQLEMFKPAAARRWGYWAMPILHGDRLVGKLDATADRAEGALVVHAIHEDQPFDADLAAAVHREVEDLARWLRLDPVLPD
jgi:uncharacterized protein YcaQ